MIGRRVQPDDFGYLDRRLEPGDYARVAPLCRSDGQPFSRDDFECGRDRPYWICCSPGGRVAVLVNHTVTEHKDGTITVSPVIRFDSEHEVWCGHLERGVWRMATTTDLAIANS